MTWKIQITRSMKAHRLRGVAKSSFFCKVKDFSGPLYQRIKSMSATPRSMQLLGFVSLIHRRSLPLLVEGDHSVRERDKEPDIGKSHVWDREFSHSQARCIASRGKWSKPSPPHRHSRHRCSQIKTRRARATASSSGAERLVLRFQSLELEAPPEQCLDPGRDLKRRHSVLVQPDTLDQLNSTIRFQQLYPKVEEAKITCVNFQPVRWQTLA